MKIEESHRKYASKKFSGVSFRREPIAVIETNVDDVSGEVLSRSVERLLVEGAYDCTIVPNVGKKGRPGFTVRVVTPKDSSERLAQTLVMETGTMGVKVLQCERWSVKRKIVQIPFHLGSYSGKISLKVVETAAGIVRAKPEAEEVRSISEATGFTFREIEDRILAIAQGYLKQSRD